MFRPEGPACWLSPLLVAVRGWEVQNCPFGRKSPASPVTRPCYAAKVDCPCRSGATRWYYSGLRERLVSGRPALARGPVNLCLQCTLTGRLFFVVPGDDIGPQGFDLAGLQDFAPRRHVVFPLRYRVGKARKLLGRKRPQIEAAPGIVQAGPMTGHAVDGIDLGALVDLGLSERRRRRILCLSTRAGERG